MALLLSQQNAASSRHSSSCSKRGGLLVAGAVKAKSARQICCSKTLVAKPENIEAVQQLCKQALEFSAQQMADRSSGVKDFSCAVDNWYSNTFHFWERYESNAAMGRHNTKPEMVKFMEEVSELLERPVGMVLYEYKDGKIGGLAVQGGPKGEGGLDDATGASGAAGGAGYKQTSKAAQLSGLQEEDLAPGPDSTKQQPQQSAATDTDDPWWTFAGSQPAAVAVLVGSAVVIALVATKISGHL